MNSTKKKLKHIHFIGIGGSGMSGLAEVLFNQGYTISGSDLKLSSVTERLSFLGITIENSHKAKNIQEVDMVIKSAAIGEENEELLEAKKLKIPILARAELLSSLMNMKRGIAVSGTHGKTTTTSLLASIMAEAMLDPTFVVGGVLNSFSTNAKLGSGEYLIAEADESDKSFLMLQPSLAIITNIDEDHLRNYNNDIKNLERAFVDFSKKLPFDGLLVVCGDDPILKNLIPSFNRHVISYGFGENNDYVVKDLTFFEFRSKFSISSKSNTFQINLNMPGKHNVLNATAAAVLAIEEEISILNIQNALNKFQGVSRRMSFLGKIEINNNLNFVVDDYGHHPTELKNTIETIRNIFPKKEVTMVFQPHRFSRTKDLFENFIKVLQLVDNLILLPIYPAGEKKIKEISSTILEKELKKQGFKKVYLSDSFSNLVEILSHIQTDKDSVLLIQGAGNISDFSLKISELKK